MWVTAPSCSSFASARLHDTSSPRVSSRHRRRRASAGVSILSSRRVFVRSNSPQEEEQSMLKLAVTAADREGYKLAAK